ncbi:unnamed protein product, partial [Penicillium salamii]
WRWQREKYVALKINSSSHHSRENAAQAELDILKRIPEADPRHKGFEFVRRPLDSFNLENGLVRHLSLVFEPLREPLWIYRQMFIGDVIPSGVLKILLQMILHGLDYLHPWTQSVRSSTLLWDILEGKKLFKDIHPLKAHEYDELGHLGHISSLLGPPPKELLDKGTRTDLFYDSDGRFKGTNIAPSKFKFEHSIRNLRNEDKRMFIKFVRRMIKWDPEERSTATELLHDPWLYAEWNSMKIELTVRSIRSPKLRMKNAC